MDGTAGIVESPAVTGSSPFRTIVFAWLVAGSMDVATALIYYPLTTPARPLRILQGIASGLLGAKAFAGGVQTALLGLGLHYLIALAWTLVFFGACGVWRPLSRHAFPVGMAYGIVVWSVMNLIVLPLSNVRRAPLTLSGSLIAAVILMFCIGLPNAIIAGRYFARRSAAEPAVR